MWKGRLGSHPHGIGPGDYCYLAISAQHTQGHHMPSPSLPTSRTSGLQRGFTLDIAPGLTRCDTLGETNDLLIRDALINELTKPQTVSASLPLLQWKGQLEAACIHMVHSTIVHSNRNCVELDIHKIKQPSSSFFQPQTIPVWDISNGISADHEARCPRA